VWFRLYDKPNILLIQTDQHNPHIAGYAGNPAVQTQHLDRLAEGGVSFDAAYCQTPLCTPSRLSMLTGRWASNCGGWANSVVRDPGQETIPSWLSKHGYVTCMVGKMHINGGDQTHGYQYRPYGDLASVTFPAHQPDPPESADGRWNDHSVGRFPFTGPTRIPESLTMDQVVTTESLAWLLEHTDEHAEQPWFFHASYPRPHFPLTAPGRYVRRYLDSDLETPPTPGDFPDGLHPHDRFTVEDFNLLKFSPEEHRRAVACYYACVDYVDDCIGSLVEGLGRAGCLDNTYVVYTSDHGDMAGEHGLWWKRTYYEGSARVPLLVTGPGIGKQERDRTPVELVDLFPTFCDWAGVDAPEGLDGESLAPLLNGEDARRQKRIARSEMLGPNPAQQFRMVFDGRWKYVDFPTSKSRLFDLATDPEELTDLASDPPSEAPVADLVAEVERIGTWDELNAQRESDTAARPKPETPPMKAAVQYRLADGRVVPADGELYK